MKGKVTLPRSSCAGLPSFFSSSTFISMTYKLLVSLLYAATVSGLPQASTQDTAESSGSGLATLSCAPNASSDMARLTRLLPKILENARTSSTKSWEYGALCQSL